MKRKANIQNFVAKHMHEVCKGGVHNKKTHKKERRRIKNDLKREYLPNCA